MLWSWYKVPLVLSSSWALRMCSLCAFRFTLHPNVYLCVKHSVYWGAMSVSPGCAAEDSDAGDERRELPFSGEQNEAHDSLSGAGEGSLPEDHWTHALMPSPWRPDRCGDDPDQNRTQRESQNYSQEALMATRGLAAVGRHSGRSEQTQTALV